jgi:hypothetical protein
MDIPSVHDEFDGIEFDSADDDSESDTSYVSEETRPRLESDRSEVSTLSDWPTRRERPSKTYILAKPAPRLATKQRRLVHIRPRLLLQLQQVTEKRAVPVFDAIPSALVSGSVIAPRVARKFPRLIRLKPELGLDDIILALSEDYSAPDTGDDGESVDELDKRELLGVVSPVPPDTAGGGCPIEGLVEIALENDVIWTAYPLSNGSYQFTRADESGADVTARWARKTIYDGATGAAVGHKYIFSVLDPNSRRHPVLARLTPTHLEIYDSYAEVKKPESSATVIDFQMPPESPGKEQELLALPPHLFFPPTFPVPDAIRSLITASAVWVTLRDQSAWPSPHRVPRNGGRRQTCRVHPPRTSQPATTAAPTPGIDRASTFPAAEAASARPYSLDGHNLSPAVSIHTAGSGCKPTDARNFSNVPRRALSTGAAFMRRRRQAVTSNDPSNPAMVLTEEAGIISINDPAVAAAIALEVATGRHASGRIVTNFDNDDGDDGDDSLGFGEFERSTFSERSSSSKSKGLKGKVRSWKAKIMQRIKDF